MDDQARCALLRCDAPAAARLWFPAWGGLNLCRLHADTAPRPYTVMGFYADRVPVAGEVL